MVYIRCGSGRCGHRCARSWVAAAQMNEAMAKEVLRPIDCVQSRHGHQHWGAGAGAQTGGREVAEEGRLKRMSGQL